MGTSSANNNVENFKIKGEKKKEKKRKKRDKTGQEENLKGN